jgi:hypothetical protein
MPRKKLPWRTLVMTDADRVGRFTREEVRQVFLELRVQREAEAARLRNERRRERRRRQAEQRS